MFSLCDFKNINIFQSTASCFDFTESNSVEKKKGEKKIWHARISSSDKIYQNTYSNYKGKTNHI